eukprot:Rhum_TRINITY_DN2389_c0_g2::Rhum_TRINITY_DN2389_c0_g2_i1::g.6756::m.6756
MKPVAAMDTIAADRRAAEAGAAEGPKRELWRTRVYHHGAGSVGLDDLYGDGTVNLPVPRIESTTAFWYNNLKTMPLEKGQFVIVQFPFGKVPEVEAAEVSSMSYVTCPNSAGGVGAPPPFPLPFPVHNEISYLAELVERVPIHTKGRRLIKRGMPPFSQQVLRKATATELSNGLPGQLKRNKIRTMKKKKAKASEAKSNEERSDDGAVQAYSSKARAGSAVSSDIQSSVKVSSWADDSDSELPPLAELAQSSASASAAVAVANADRRKVQVCVQMAEGAAAGQDGSQGEDGEGASHDDLLHLSIVGRTATCEVFSPLADEEHAAYPRSATQFLEASHHFGDEDSDDDDE